MISLFVIELALVFAFALEIMQLEQYLLLLLFCVAVLESNKHGKLTFNATLEFFVLVIAFTVFYFTMMLNDRIPLNAFFALRYWIGPILAYYIGITIGNSSPKRVVLLIIVIALGTFLHGCLNVMTTSDLAANNRSVTNFWTGSITSATLQGTYFVFGIALAAFWMTCGSNKKKAISVIMMGMVIWNNMQTASRTALFLLGIVLVCAIIVKQYIDKGRKDFAGFVFSTILILLVVVGFTVVVFKNDIGGVRTVFESSFLGQRLAGIEDEGALSRSELWIAAIRNIIAYPMGVPQHEHYAHNFWLDIGLSGGVIAMVLLVVYSCMSIKTMWRVCKNEKIAGIRVLVYMLYLATTISYMLEPILQAVPYTFCCFVMINGAIASLEYMVE